MKAKLLYLVLISSILIGLSSCTQEYICQCEVSYEGAQPGLPDSSIHQFLIRDTKEEAKSKCEANSFEYNNGGITTKEECQLY